jgi:hypothetical protein
MQCIFYFQFSCWCIETMSQGKDDVFLIVGNELLCYVSILQFIVDSWSIFLIPVLNCGKKSFWLAHMQINSICYCLN